MAKKNLSEDIKLTLQRLELEKQIFDIGERSNKSFKDFAAAKKKIFEIDKEILNLEKQLSILANDQTEEGKKKTEELTQQKIRQQEILKETKKELSILKTIGNEIGTKINGALSQQANILSRGLGMYYDMDESVRRTSMSLGLSTSRMIQLRKVSMATADHFAKLGYTSTDMVETQAAYSEEVGRTVMLSAAVANEMANVGKLTGLGVKEVGTLAGQMEQFGLGAKLSVQYIGEIKDLSQSMGVNSGKVIKKFQQNLGLLNKLNFKGGVTGLARMSAYSEKFKVNMSSIASSAEKLFSPEGAIEAAANLQVLGGGFAAIADPFQMMFNARNDPEKFAESIVNSLKGIGQFKDGEFIVSAYDLQRIEEAGKALGMSKDEMVEMAKQKAKMDKIGGFMLGMSKEEKELLSGITEINKNGKAVVTLNGETKLLSELNENQRKTLIEQQKTSESNAKDAMSAREQWKGIGNQILASTLPLMDLFSTKIMPFIQKLSDFVSNNPLWTLGGVITTAILGSLGDLGVWLLRGRTLGLGFNMTAGKEGGFFSKMFNGKKGESPIGGVPGKTMPSPVGGQTIMDPKKIESVGNAAGGAATKLLAFGAAVLMIGGGIAIAALGISTLVNSFRGLTDTEIMGALGSMVILLGGFVGILYTMSPAILALGAAATPVTIPLLALGAAFLMIGGGIAIASYGLSLLVDSFGNLFSTISPENITPLLMLGPALIGVSFGVLALSGSLMVLAASLLGGGFLGLMALSQTGETLKETFGSIDPDGISKSINSINTVDMDRINALKELSTMMTAWGMFGAKPIEIRMKIDGDIELSGEGGGKSNTDWINDPTFVSKLKNIISQQMSKDRNGAI